MSMTPLIALAAAACAALAAPARGEVFVLEPLVVEGIDVPGAGTPQTLFSIIVNDAATVAIHAFIAGEGHTLIRGGGGTFEILARQGAVPSFEYSAGDPSSAAFCLPIDLEIRGGFAGDEARADERDPEAHVTSRPSSTRPPGSS